MARGALQTATSAWRLDRPACFSGCGILSDGTIIDADSVDWAGPSVPDIPLVVAATGTGTVRGCFEGSAVVVFTDGACIYNQIPSLHRAGVGVWWGDGHANNYSAPLPGQVQTNQRAELAAIIYAAKNEPRTLHIKSDSAYVVNGCSKHRHAWAALNWYRIKHAVLWKELHLLIESRSMDSVTISKVKGHASHRDVKQGKVKMQDKLGNDGADTLATTGAAAHALPPHVVRRVMLRFAVAEDVQRLMVDVVTARSSHARLARTMPQHKHRQPASVQVQPSEQFETLQPISVSSEASFVFSVATNSGSIGAGSSDSHSNVNAENIETISSGSEAYFVQRDNRAFSSPSSEPVWHDSRVDLNHGLTQHPMFSGINHPT